MAADPYYEYYSKPQVGGLLPVYAGAGLQTGGGLFSLIARFAVPLIRKIAMVAKPAGRLALGAAKSIAKRTAKSAAGGLKDAVAEEISKVVVGSRKRKRKATGRQQQQTGGKRRRLEKDIFS